MEHGQYEEALVGFGRALDLGESSERTTPNRGTALFRLGRYEEALLQEITSTTLDRLSANLSGVWDSRSDQFDRVCVNAFVGIGIQATIDVVVGETCRGPSMTRVYYN